MLKTVNITVIKQIINFNNELYYLKLYIWLVIIITGFVLKLNLYVLQFL